MKILAWLCWITEHNFIWILAILHHQSEIIESEYQCSHCGEIKFVQEVGIRGINGLECIQKIRHRLPMNGFVV